MTAVAQADSPDQPSFLKSRLQGCGTHHLAQDNSACRADRRRDLKYAPATHVPDNRWIQIRSRALAPDPLHGPM